jgi:hypothetical protein
VQTDERDDFLLEEILRAIFSEHVRPRQMNHSRLISPLNGDGTTKKNFHSPAEGVSFPKRTSDRCHSRKTASRDFANINRVKIVRLGARAGTIGV